jgi:hypothetical protein
MSMNNEGYVLWLRCTNCGTEFPVFIFSGENDWTTSGLRTKTDLEKKMLYVYAHDDTPPSGSEVALVKAERVASIPGESFQDYRNRTANSEDRYIFGCVKCQSDHAEGIGKLELSQLKEKGYELINLT